MLRIVSLIAALCWAAPAYCDCPTSQDSEKGLVLTRLNPYFANLYKVTSAGLTEQRVMAVGDRQEWVSEIYYHPLLIGQRSGPNKTLEMFYTGSVPQLDDLPSNKTWTSQVSLYLNRQKVGDGSDVISFGGFTKKSIGSCSYAVWIVNERLQITGKEPITYEKYYSPLLKLVIGAIRLDAQGLPISQVEYDKIEVEGTH